MCYFFNSLFVVAWFRYFFRSVCISFVRYVSLYLFGLVPPLCRYFFIYVCICLVRYSVRLFVISLFSSLCLSLCIVCIYVFRSFFMYFFSLFFRSLFLYFLVSLFL